MEQAEMPLKKALSFKRNIVFSFKPSLTNNKTLCLIFDETKMSKILDIILINQLHVYHCLSDDPISSSVNPVLDGNMMKKLLNSTNPIEISAYVAPAAENVINAGPINCTVGIVCLKKKL